MFFDFFALKIKAESKASDEIFLGYFFGKSHEKLEYRFISFPRRYSRQLSLDLNMPLSGFKEFMNNFYQELMMRSSDFTEMTSEFMRYLDMQIKKVGGREALALRISKIIEENEPDVVKMEISDLFQNWTSSLDLDMVIETSTYEELTTSFLAEIDVNDFTQTLSQRNDLITMPEVYPLVDPLEGISIDDFDIGDTIYCTILGFTSEEQQNLLVEEFPTHFDAENINTVPLEGIIISKEILPAISRNFVLIKIQIGRIFQAKSIVLRSIRLMYDPEKMKKRISNIKNEADEDSLSLADAMNKYKKRTISVQKLEETGKTSFSDFFLSSMLVLMIIGLIIIIVYFFILT